MFNFFDSLSGIISSIINFVLTIFDLTFLFISFLFEAFVFIGTSIGYLPFFVRGFVALTLFVIVLLNLLNKGA